MDLLFKLAIVVLIGCLLGKLAKMLKLSHLFGYLIAGLLLGPSFSRLISSQDLASLSVIADVALAIVAFKVGSEFVWRDMKKLGRSHVFITIAEALVTVLMVFVVLFFVLKQDFVFSSVMAALAAATAPAATIMVMRQYRSDGPVTRTLLPVAALDGVLGVVFFGIVISLAVAFVNGDHSTAWQVVGQSGLQIGGSLVLGAVLGLFLTFFGKRAGDTDELLIITLAMLLVSTSITKLFGLSPLFTNIMMGSTLVNLSYNSNRVFFGLNHFTPPLLLLFFTLAGASLDLSRFMGLVVVGVAYLVARSGGKLLGAWLGTKGAGSEPTVQRYLGLALLPQGGISVALAVLVRQHLPEYSLAVITIIVVSVMLYELVGTMLAKKAIEGAGEIGGMGRQFDGVK